MRRQDRIDYYLALQEKLKREARVDLLKYTLATMPNFVPAEFHKRYYAVLTRFAHKEIKKLMVFMPPQHGKSEGSTRRLPSFIEGIAPDTRIAIISFSATKARKFNREIQRIMDSDQYAPIFPETRLDGRGTVTGGKWVRNADEFEVVGHSGSVKTIGVCGPLTGDPVDVLIIDDIYKDAKSAWSPVIRENISDWYDTVAETRLHNGSQQLIVFTRWHQDDLAGHLLKEQGIFDPETNPEGWVVVTYKAIKEGQPTEYDDREEGEALWPERHNLETLLKRRQRNPLVFNSLYQQEPKPLEGLMYSNGFKEYEVIPYTKAKIVKNYTDTADEGDDFLCSINYLETDIGNFVLNVLYTQKPMEYTEPKTAEMLTKDNVDVANIESNNGGRGFARNVEKQLRLMGNNTTKIKWFHQTDNKNVRIYVASGEVQNIVYFPKGWRTMWPEFAAALDNYLRVGKNEHDDAPDALTGTIEKRPKRTGKKDLSALF